MRALFLAAAAALCVALSDTPKFAPAEKSSVVKTITSEMKLESTGFTMTIDGRELPKEMTGAMSMSMQETKKLGITDRYVKCAGGRPLELDRTYDELVSTSHEASLMPGQGEEKVEDKAEESDLEGKTVRFSWNSKDEKYETAFAGEEGDAGLLKDLHEDLDFRGVLPPEDAKVKDTWKVEGRALNQLLSAGGNLHFHESGKEEKEPKSREFSDQLDENITGDIEATFEKVNEVDGHRLAVIQLKGDLKSHGVESDFAAEITLDVEGEVIWDLTLNRLESVDITAKTECTMKLDKDVEAGGKSHAMHIEIILAGDARVEVATKTP